MSETNLKLLSNEELIDLALSPEAEKTEKLRLAALQEHCERTKNLPRTLVETSETFEILAKKVADLRSNSHS